MWKGSLLLDKGLIKWVGKEGETDAMLGLIKAYGTSLETIDAKGLWVTPGYVHFDYFSREAAEPFSSAIRIVDLHSHVAVGSSPALRGASDSNSVKAPAQPWLRSIDGLNTHDESFRLAVAGGVTTTLVLPGSADAIGTCIHAAVFVK